MKTVIRSLVVIFFCSMVLLAQTVNIKIIETTDTHGKIYPYDFKNDSESNSSLAQVHTYIKGERAKDNQHVILLSGGDILQGTPAVYYYNFEDTSSTHLYADVMNYMGYNAGAVGNHDIEAGHDVYDSFTAQLNFPWLAANAVSTETNEPYFEPYTILEKEGVKIAVLGMITPHIPNWLPKKIWSGMRFEDMVETAEKWIKIIQEKDKPDLMIGLFHAGVNYEYGGVDADTYKNENASQLVAERVNGFDIIFVGHDHQGWNKTVKAPNGKDVFIMGGSSYARQIVEANITMNYDSISNRWNKKILGELIDAREFKPDSLFLETFSEQFNIVKEYVSKPIGELTESISTRESMFGASAFCDLINVIQLELTDADVSFTAPLSGDAELRKGKIYVRDMFKLYRYENLLYTMELSGKEILDYLEYTSDRWFNVMSSENDHLLNFVRDENGELIYSNRSNAPLLKDRFYNFDSALGIDYIIDVSKPVSERVVISGFSNGNDFDLVANYKVAINSYRGNGGGGHLIKGAGIDENSLENRVINSTEKDLRFYLMKWIEEQQVVQPKNFGNWKVVPEDWWFNGMKKDYKLIFSSK
jgi:2',3'-cyclic-nucleotide 2'-phosphodiesterase/3'-nucleotidase